MTTADMTTVLVIAKAPVPGRVKTRLAADIGEPAAARVAAAALHDTIDACVDAVGADRCRLALDGELGAAVDGEQIRRALSGWTVRPQQRGGLGQRIAAACAAVTGPVVVMGMDTPQVTGALLRQVASGLDHDDAVLGPAEDGGWWVLGLRDPAAAEVVAAVPMSTARTGADTRAALTAGGLGVGSAPVLRDIDWLVDLRTVAELAPCSRVAARWREILGEPVR